MTTAIVGFGKMGKLYDSLLRAHYIIDPLSVGDRSQFSYIEEFIEYKPKIDLVIVSTPINSHFYIVNKLLDNNYNVLCEKPICMETKSALILERKANKRNLILCQSTLERYNPLIKFVRNNISVSEVKRVESYRYGTQPVRGYTDNPIFDLGIHDADLSFYLFNNNISWKINAGYGFPRREIVITLKDDSKITLDLLNKHIFIGNKSMDFSTSSQNNPILEMILDIDYKGRQVNEAWSREIKFLEQEMS